MGFGDLYNPQATSNCQYCRYSTGDEYLKTLDISWNDRWRNFGFMWAYVCFNVGMIVLVTYIPRAVRKMKKRRQGQGIE
jgi:ATP-binding cassette subfamily G (WHITE) protein 2 (SNQ2)